MESKTENGELWKYKAIYDNQPALTGLIDQAQVDPPPIEESLVCKQPPGHANYGHSNHGEALLDAFGECTSLLDIGCGHNQFVESLRRANPQGCYVGMDFACPSADLLSDITDVYLPFTHRFFEYVTAFDMLEHLTEEQVPKALFNMREISSAFCFTISHVPSNIKVDGHNLHPTVKDVHWWLDTLQKYSKKVSYNSSGYFMGRWNHGG